MVTFLLLSMAIFGQSNALYKTWEFGVMMGGSYYQGDLHDYSRNGVNILDETHFAYGLYGKKYISKPLDLRLSLFRGAISADEANFINSPIHEERGFNFYSKITELSLIIDYDFLGSLRFKDEKFHELLSPYIFTGVAAQFTSPTNYWGENPTAELQLKIDKDIQNNHKTHFAIPLGLGVHYDVSARALLSFELGTRFVFSDYLDGVSVSANPDKNDWDAFGSIQFGFKLGMGIDTDGDGILDKLDKCPTVFGVALFEGCPDTDGDGIEDAKDNCPQEAGTIEFEGCPDTDKDGIEDSKDNCPEVKGLLEFNGCPDTDGDGIMDKEDNCPYDGGLKIHGGCPDRDADGVPDNIDNCPRKAGLEKFKGCPDTDGDGVQDKYDLCPKEKGVPENNGCPLLDTDGDGIADLYDKCPEIKGLLSNEGCPEVGLSNTEGNTNTIDKNYALGSAMERRVYFRTASAIVSAAESLKVTEVALYLEQFPEAYVKLLGKADHRGDASLNKELSIHRAEQVKSLLIQKGIAPYRITHIDGLGEVNSSGKTEDELKEYRSVDIFVFKK
jgi:outer membrane protein OmpA-like peptidoglycan-associated protein